MMQSPSPPRIVIDIAKCRKQKYFTPDRRFLLKGCIGKGGEGSVYSAYDSFDRIEVVVKIMQLQGKKADRMVIHQRRLMQLNHENIVRIIDVQIDNECCYVIMEKCDKDLLIHLLESDKNRLSEFEASVIFRQMIRAVFYSHQHGIFHGDIKPENLLLSEDGEVRLTDFTYNLHFLEESSVASPRSPVAVSLPLTPLTPIESGALDTNFESDRPVYAEAKYLAETKKFLAFLSASTLRSSVYSAPELFSRLQLDSENTHSISEKLSQSDVWSCGITLFVLCAGFIPWSEASISDPEFARFVASPEMFFPVWFSQNLKNFLSNLLELNPSKRLTLDTAWNHPWMHWSASMQEKINRNLVTERIFDFSEQIQTKRKRRIDQETDTDSDSEVDFSLDDDESISTSISRYDNSCLSKKLRKSNYTSSPLHIGKTIPSLSTS